MEVKVEKVSPSQRKLEVIVPEEMVETEINSIYQMRQKQAKIKGFRQGKVPMAMIKSLYHEEVISRALSNLVEKTYPEALKEVKLTPLKETALEPEMIVEGKPFKYVMTMEVIPEFELPQYKGILVEVEPITVNEEEVEAELKRLQELHGELKKIDDPRPLKQGDYAIVDFKGYVGETLLKDFNATDYMVELGKKQLHEDIEKEILGTMVGERKVVKLNYPKDHANKKLAGKEISLHLVVRDAKEKVLAPLNDGFAQTLGNYQKLQDLKEAVREQLKEKKEAIRDEYIKNYVLTHLSEKVDIEVPESLIEEESKNIIERTLQFSTPQAQQSLDLEKMKKDLRPGVVAKVKAGLILNRIAKEEKITTQEQEIEEGLKLLASNLKVPLEKMHTPYIIDKVRARLIGEKVAAFLKDQVRIKEVMKKTQPEKEADKDGFNTDGD
jgi:trigger factor